MIKTFASLLTAITLAVGAATTAPAMASAASASTCPQYRWTASGAGAHAHLTANPCNDTVQIRVQCLQYIGGSYWDYSAETNRVGVQLNALCNVASVAAIAQIHYPLHGGIWHTFWVA
jgi:hypothetical protein